MNIPTAILGSALAAASADPGALEEYQQSHTEDTAYSELFSPNCTPTEDDSPFHLPPEIKAETQTCIQRVVSGEAFPLTQDEMLGLCLFRSRDTVWFKKMECDKTKKPHEQQDKDCRKYSRMFMNGCMTVFENNRTKIRLLTSYFRKQVKEICEMNGFKRSAKPQQLDKSDHPQCTPPKFRFPRSPSKTPGEIYY